MSNRNKAQLPNEKQAFEIVHLFAIGTLTLTLGGLIAICLYRIFSAPPEQQQGHVLASIVFLAVMAIGILSMPGVHLRSRRRSSQKHRE